MNNLNEQTRAFYLYGSFAEKFSKEPLHLAVHSPKDALLAFKSIFPEWRQHVAQSPELVFIVSDKGFENPKPIEAVFFESCFGDAEEVHIIPAQEGAGFEVAAMMGITNVFAAFAVNAIASMVINMALGAVMQALAPSPKTSAGSRNQVAENKSFLFDGAENVVQQGGPVPVVYGYFLTGSTVVSSEIAVTQLLQAPAQSVQPANPATIRQPSYPPAVPWQWLGGVTSE